MAVRLTAGLLPYFISQVWVFFCCVLVTAPSIVKERQVKNALLSLYLVTVCKLHKPSLGASCTLRILVKESADSTKFSGC